MIFPPLESDEKDLMQFMRKDKKMALGALSYILVNGIGKAHVTKDVQDKDVAEILKHSLNGN